MSQPDHLGEHTRRAMIPDGQGSVLLSETAEATVDGGAVLIAVEAYSVNRGETFLLDRPRDGWRACRGRPGRPDPCRRRAARPSGTIRR